MPNGTPESTRPDAYQKAELLKEAGEAHAAFLRWQEVRRTQLGYVVNLVLTFSTASLGFGVKLILDKPSFIFNCVGYCSLYVLLIAIGFGLLTNLSRLCDFRYTSKTARSREMKNRKKAGESLTDKEKRQAEDYDKNKAKADCFGQYTWLFLKLQCLGFLIGIVLLVGATQCGLKRGALVRLPIQYSPGLIGNEGVKG